MLDYGVPMMQSIVSSFEESEGPGQQVSAGREADVASAASSSQGQRGRRRQRAFSREADQIDSSELEFEFEARESRKSRSSNRSSNYVHLPTDDRAAMLMMRADVNPLRAPRQTNASTRTCRLRLGFSKVQNFFRKK